MGQLISPGVDVQIIDESFYNSAGQGTIPLFVIATATNKPSSTAGAGIAPFTMPSQAGKLFLATSQRDLLQNFGNPIFHSVQGTAIHGHELNEYGLHAAYSFLGISNRAYIIRADLDLSQLEASVTAPVGAPIGGTYWFDLTSTQWGVFRANGNTTPGSAWVHQPVRVAMTANVDVNDVPLTGFGANGDIAVVPINASNYLYEKIGGTWYKIGSTAWQSHYPTVLTGSVANPTLIQNNAFIVNGTTVTITQASPTVANVASDINGASITNITATTSSGHLVITNTAGGSITLSNSVGTPLTALGLTAGAHNGVSVFRTNNAQYPDGSVTNSIWVKGNPANSGAKWYVKYYNATTAQFILLTAPFYVFDSTLTDGNPSKDAAAIAALGSPAAGTIYVGYDVTTGDQQLRRWNGTQWEPLSYEADVVAPSTSPVDGTYWYNPDFRADIMVGNGENWISYRRTFPLTDASGPQIAGSAPATQLNGNPLVDNDLWIDASDLENYPKIYRYDTTTSRWNLVDNTDQTTPFGIVFADARADSGPTFTGIANSGDYVFNSVASADMSLSDYVDPDAPDPRTHPAGVLLFNTRYSTYNVKVWKEAWFTAGGFDPNTDFTIDQYNIGSSLYTFDPVATAGRWVTASGNKIDGSPYMGRKAQRIMVVRGLSAIVEGNQDIRSELIYFNLMAAPGYPELLNDFVNLNTEMKEVAFTVGDTPIRLKPDGTSIQNWAGNAANVSGTGEDGLTVGNHFVGIYYPWGLGENVDGTEIMIPPSTIALVTYAYNDQVAYPWYAPAGFNRGLVTNAKSVGYLSSEGEYTPVILNNGQRDVLYLNKINPIAYIPNRGLVVYGQKTLNPIASALDRVNVARLANYIAYHLDNNLKPFLFEQNDAAVRAAAKTTCERFFNTLVGLDGLYDYAVVCDLTNNTPDRIDRNELWIDCLIRPVKSIEFIYVPVRIQTTSAVANTVVSTIS